VLGLGIAFQNLRKIPQDIDRYFKNIISFQMYRSNLGTLTKEDLKQFPNLVLLSIIENDIAVLAADTFIYNQNLEHVHIRGNLLLTVGQNLFKNLNHLISVDFRWNPCVDVLANSGEILYLNEQLRILCSEEKQLPTEWIERIVELEKQIREISASPCSCSTP
jgi:hypothetical protein